MKIAKIIKGLPSSLRHRITIQQRSSTADGAGGVTFQWQSIITVWAAVELVSIKEKLLQGRVSQQATHRFYIRFRDDITHNDRIQYNNDVFSILTIEDVNQRKVVLGITARAES